MDKKRRTMLTASQPASQPSIILPFFLVKSKVAYFFKAYSAVLKRAGCARSETGGVRPVYLSALLPLQQGGEGG